MINPKCPHCNVELECDDTYDTIVADTVVVLFKVGYCPECGRDYQWETSARIDKWEITDLRLR